MTKKLHYLTIFLFVLCHSLASAQYYKEHYIAPAPWQYWSTANEIVIGTLSTTPVTVTITKSDNTPIVVLNNITVNNPVSYRFDGDAFGVLRNTVNTTYTDRGIIINATEPVLVNLRNIATDATQLWLQLGTSTIKGNASLVSFGKEGLGVEFRLGYYRTSVAGLFDGAPVYSVMATENNTVVNLPTAPALSVTLQKGESRLFKAPIGSLLTADKPVVMNTGSWGDQPQVCGGNGEDGTVDQIAPVNVLGTKYLVVRGRGASATTSQQNLFYGPEQTTFVTTQDQTTFSIQHFNAAGALISSTPTTVLNAAGSVYTFYHGDGQNQYSSSLVVADKPIIVYSGTAVGCETDISTVLPIGGCAGFTNVQTKKFINYTNQGLDYFGFTIIESPTANVMLNGVNIMTFAGVTRTTLTNSGFDMIRFTRTQINDPENIILSSSMPLTTSIVQQQDNISSMSAFFSAFGAAALAPVIAQTNEDCTITLEAQQDPDITDYEWFRNGISIGITQNHQQVVTESGDYAVNVKKGCGWGNRSLPLHVELTPCSDLSIEKEVLSQLDDHAVFKLKVKNNDAIFTDPNVVVQDVLPSGYTFQSYTASQGTYDAVTGQWSVGALVAGEEATLEITVLINDQGEYLNTASVHGNNLDKIDANNSASAIIRFGSMDVTKKAEKVQYYTIGEKIHYTISIKNTGDQSLTNIQIIDENADPGSIQPATIATLAPGATTSVVATHTITVDDFINGQVQNQALILATTPTGSIQKLSDDPSTQILDDPTQVAIIRVADLYATKDDGISYYEPGQETTYQIVVENKGVSSAVNVIVEDPMPTGVTEMSWRSSLSTQGVGSLHDVIPVLLVGDQVTYQVTLKIPRTHTGDFVNKVWVTSPLNEDTQDLCEGCTDINRQKISIPKGISPNGDGINDMLSLEQFHVANIVIYNRLGTEVYAKKDYKNEWKGQTNDNKMLPSGTYFYHITIIDGSVFTGYIQLIREN